MSDLQEILDKYQDTIKEELNIKEVVGFQEDIKITKVFKPNGAKLSNKFGKDTGKIIQFGKQGNIKEFEENRVAVFDGEGNEWTLEKEEYEITYEGLEGDNMSADQNIIIKMDLTLTPELLKEGVAREVSRFLNQMRKDADYSVDAKVDLTFETADEYLKDIILEFKDFLAQEALIKNIENSTPIGELVSDFELEGKVVRIGLKK